MSFTVTVTLYNGTSATGTYTNATLMNENNISVPNTYNTDYEMYSYRYSKSGTYTYSLYNHCQIIIGFDKLLNKLCVYRTLTISSKNETIAFIYPIIGSGRSAYCYETTNYRVGISNLIKTEEEFYGVFYSSILNCIDVEYITHFSKGDERFLNWLADNMFTANLEKVYYYGRWVSSDSLYIDRSVYNKLLLKYGSFYKKNGSGI
jgi:hypothetical protein